MSPSTHTTRILLLLALLALPTVVTAQQTGTTTTEQPTLVDLYETSFARMTIEFWTPKLNRYRVEIDRMLAASDLVEVNELRTRAALLLERIQESEKKRRERRYESTTDTAMIARDMVTDTTSTYEVATDTAMTMSEMSSASEDEEDMVSEEQQLAWEREYEREQAARREEELRQLELVLAGDEEAVDNLRGDDDDERHMYAEDLEHYNIREGIAEIRYVTKWIARNYRPGMQELLAKIFVDLEEYFEATRQHSREFITSNRIEALDDENIVSRMLETLRMIKEGESLKAATGPRAEMAKSIIESILMVYNGQDLRDIFMIDGGPIASSAIEKLPASNNLGQNMPNPASSRTTIPYTLAEAGNRVVLQILDTRGALVATFDQGSRDAGSHSIVVDVTTLPPGTYLYQLKVTTTAGEQVSSKGMQVVR